VHKFDVVVVDFGGLLLIFVREGNGKKLGQRAQSGF